MPIAPISKRSLNVHLVPVRTRTIGTTSLPLIAMSICWISAESRPLCSVSMTSQSIPARAISSATLGLPSPRKQPMAGFPAFTS